MSPQRIPFLLSIATLSVAGLAIVAFVHAQTETKTFAGSATFQSGDAGGTVENNTLIAQKVINLRNTGSHSDTFRTTLPINPDTRCGLRGPNDVYPTNTLPNPLPTTLDIPLAVNGTSYIVVVCVTNGLAPGPFTWSYKTISLGSVDAGSEKVLAEVQDTVNVTEPTPCTDSDGGMSTGVKGIATGTYSGARPGYTAIYGQEPNPNTPKTTTDKFSTYIDHCSWDSIQLNEGFCGADGRLSAIGLQCAKGCKDGACIQNCTLSTAITSSCSCGNNVYKAGDGYCCEMLSGNGVFLSYSACPVRPSACTLVFTGNKAAYAAGEMVNYTYTCPASADVIVQVVKPDGTITTYVTVKGGTSQSLGFATANLPAGSYTLRLCVNDPACQPPSIVAVPFTVTAPSLGVAAPPWTGTGSSTSLPLPSGDAAPPASFPSTNDGVGGRISVVPSQSTPSVLPVVPSIPPTMRPTPSSIFQTGSSVVLQKTVSKTRVQASRKQQQALRKELRTLERSLLRKRNHVALSQIADLRDELADLDLHDPSAAEILKSLQEEIAELRSAVSKKRK